MVKRLIGILLVCGFGVLMVGCDVSESEVTVVQDEPTVEVPGDEWALVDLGPLVERRDFLTATALVSSGVGRRADDSPSVDGVKEFRLTRREADQALDRFGERVQKSGCMLIRHEVRIVEGLETLMLLPTDQAELAIRAIGTQGKSPAVSPAEIVKRYKKLRAVADGRLRLREIGDQHLQAVVLGEAEEIMLTALAETMIEICPALVEMQGYQVQTLAEEIGEEKLIDLWWP